MLLWLSCAGAYAGRPVILVYGDSISAAHGMNEDQGWVHLLSQRLQTENSPFAVVNASASGETTGGGLVRLPKTLRLHQPKIVVLELGGNDGLRGYPIDRIRANLAAMIRLARAAGAKVLLIGMVLPPNYGQRYTDAFHGIYPALARQFHVPLVSQLLDGIDTPRDLLQADGIHPTPKAQPIMLREIWSKLAPLLKQFQLQGHVGSDQ